MISVVIATHNQEYDLKHNLSRTLTTLHQESINDIIVVDDASSDSTVSYIRTHFPKLKLCESQEKIGLLRAYNRGVQLASEDLVLCWAPDMDMTSLNVKALKTRFQEPDVFALAPAVYKISKTGRKKDLSLVKGIIKGGCLKLERKSPLLLENNEEHALICPGKRALLVSKEKFNQLQGFDPSYHALIEPPLDLCYRAWKRGWKTWHTTQIEGQCISHYKINLSVKGLYQLQMQHDMLFFWKNINDTWLVWQHIVAIVISGLTFNIGYTRAFLSMITKLTSILQTHKQKLPQLYSDKEILTLTT